MHKILPGLAISSAVMIVAAALWVALGPSRAMPPAPPPETTPAVPRPQAALPVQYELTDTIDPGVAGARGIALGEQGTLYVAGAQVVRALSPAGQTVREYAAGGPATCVTVGKDGSVFVGLRTRVIAFQRDGRKIAAWGKEGHSDGEFGVVTSIAVYGAMVFVADAGNRCVHRFARNGDYVDDIGKRDTKAGIVGLVCPSPFLDCAVAEDGALVVINPGLRRVETYDLNGTLAGYWGKAGLEPAEFSGCCNPTNLALLPDGGVVTAQKLPPRVSVYGPDHKLRAWIGPEQFTKEAAGLDIAVDASGRLFVLDPGDDCIRVFTARKNGAAHE